MISDAGGIEAAYEIVCGPLHTECGSQGDRMAYALDAGVLAYAGSKLNGPRYDAICERLFADLIALEQDA